MATSARYEQRQLLEQLMGRDALRSRNSYNNQYTRQRELNINDPKICKNYLLGVCPYDLFQNTKQLMGNCKKLHIDKFRIQYEADIEEGKGRNFERIELEVLENIINFIELNDYKIKEANENLEADEDKQDEEMRAIIQRETKNLEAAENNVNITLQEIKKLNSLGEIEKSLQLVKDLEEREVKREFFAKNLRQANDNLTQSLQQKLQVCTKCGAYLSRLDSDKRLSDHFLGKIHLNYVKIRGKLQELKAKYGDMY
ncbi:hypothetical protein WICMUC_002443 [Wickerhamomyces mucosus]|uniref:Uncharacterized protein n=1 Tax=Wickerhamomyces mucosus TaxID=1378264 RepID=A0A9P8TDU3_9ASCO|nr:hypothetical protein WICMUC_002443 [Wickerhamomyces mucosus]